MKRAHMTTPCENCPYRMDAPRRHWHRSEFENVLASEADMAAGGFGTTFGCHKQIDLPQNERGFCAGWALDQQARGVPSIAFRLLLTTDPSASKAFRRLSAAGLTMFKTVAAMCRANGVRSPRTRVRKER